MHAPGDDPAGGPTGARGLFGLFTVLLALALLLHQVWWDGFEVVSPHAVVVLAAFWVLLRPTSVGRFLVLVAAEVAAVAIDMPGAGSHTVLAAVCGASILGFAGASVLSERRLPSPGALFERVAPFLRVALLILYAAAALAKMNSGFFDAAVSCGVAMSGAIVWFDPTLVSGSWRVVPVTWGAVLVEASLPLLLALPRTRVAGLVLGAGFHLVLALAGNVPFSSLALALYVAFLGVDVPDRALAAFPRLRDAAQPPGWARPAAFAGLVAAWLLAGRLAEAEPALAADLIATGTRLVVVALVVLAFVVALRLRQGTHRPRSPVAGTARVAHPVFAAGLLVLVLNAASPYLGLKTESSFTMFSNLQTEGGSWNHAFVPEAVRIFGFQDDLVRVTASNDPALLRRSSAGTRLVRFELERYLRLNPSSRASAVPAARGGSGGAEAGPVTRLVLDRVAKFRDVRAAERRGC